jgi:hypothetical protein
MNPPVTRFLLLAALVAVLAGCGSKGGSSPGTANEPTGGGGVNGISVGNCLNEDENFLVQPSANALDGQSPGGVTFTLTFYKDEAAAKAAARKIGGHIFRDPKAKGRGKFFVVSRAVYPK